MKIILTILILCVAGVANAQQNVVTDAQKQQSIINAANQNIANDNADIAIQQGVISAATAQLNLDNTQIAQYNAANAQTPAQVNWDYVDGLEIAGIRYTQWSATQTGANWNSIIPALGITCSPTESAVNWNNLPNCESKGVNMGQPYGNWTTGMADFMCGNGSISGTC